MTRKDVNQHTAAVLNQFGITCPPVPVEQIAVSLGIQVVRSAAEWSESGFLLRDGKQVMIGVNSRNSPKRQRFTIAHELGHWSLHEGKPLIVDQSVMINKRDDVSSQATDQEEIEANKFAARLLMPIDFIAATLKKLEPGSIGSRDELISKLAREFDVSNESMGWRLINLGVLSN